MDADSSPGLIYLLQAWAFPTPGCNTGGGEAMTGRCSSCGVTAIRRRIACLPAGMSLMLCAACYYDHTDRHGAEG